MLERRQVAILVGITLVGAAIRFATLDLQSFHHDEAVTAERIILPNLFDTLAAVEDSERSPPLYYVLTWIWTKLFGTSDAGLRSLSALAGTLTIPAGYLAGRELVGRAASASRVGLCLASFVALSPYLVWYSQEARSYAFLVLFATLALAYFARSLRDPSARALGLWALASALSVLSHYFAVFLIAPQALWLLWSFRDDLRPALAAVLAVAAVGLALLPLARAQEGDDRRNGFSEIALASRVGEVGMNYVASEEPEPFESSARVDAVQGFAAAAGGTLLLAAVALVAARASPAETEGAVIAIGVAVSAIAIPVLLAVVGIDFVNPRNLIAGLVPLLAFAAVGFAGEAAGRLGLAMAAATGLLFAGIVAAVNVSAEMHRANWRGAASAIGDATETRLLVINNNGDTPLSRYLGAAKFNNHDFAAGAEVEEIEVLSTTFDVEPPAGFRETSRESLPPIFLHTRLEAAKPRRVVPSDLVHVLRERSTFLIDPPP